MLDVVVVGTFGTGNPVEGATLDVIVRALPGVGVGALSLQAEETERGHDCVAVPLSDPEQAAKTTAEAELVVLTGDLTAGGGIPGTDAVWRAVLSRLPPPRARVAAVGVGVGLMTAGRERRWMRSIAHRAAAFVSRDASSARNLAAAGIVPPFWVGADLAWAAACPGGEHSAASGALLCVEDWGTMPDLERVAELCRRRGLETTLQQWPSVDGWPTRPQPPVSAWHPIPTPRDINEACAVVGSFRLAVVAGRDPAIVAAGAGVPALVVAPDGPLHELAGRLGQPAVRPDDPEPVIAAALERALEAGPPIPEAVGRQVETARHTLGILQALLEGVDSTGMDTSGLRLVDPRE